MNGLFLAGVRKLPPNGVIANLVLLLDVIPPKFNFQISVCFFCGCSIFATIINIQFLERPVNCFIIFLPCFGNVSFICILPRPSFIPANTNNATMLVYYQIVFAPIVWYAP